MASVVEDEARPVGMEAAARIGVLEQVRAVEHAEAVRVGREVGRHPVHDHADALLVQAIDHRHQIIGRAVARGGREEARDLIAPRSVERVLEDRHQLDVGEPEVSAVLADQAPEIAVAEHLAVIAPPGAEVQLVDRDRRAMRDPRPTGLHPLAIAPHVLRLPHHGGGRGRMLGARRERIGLVARHPIGPDDRVLVASAVADRRDHALPDPRRFARREHVRARAPPIPVPDHADRARVGRPDREARAALDRMRSELLIEPVVRTLVEQEQIVGGQERHGRRTIRHLGDAARSGITLSSRAT